jgi:hypothetical protein
MLCPLHQIIMTTVWCPPFPPMDGLASAHTNNTPNSKGVVTHKSLVTIHMWLRLQAAVPPGGRIETRRLPRHLYRCDDGGDVHWSLLSCVQSQFQEGAVKATVQRVALIHPTGTSTRTRMPCIGRRRHAHTRHPQSSVHSRQATPRPLRPPPPPPAIMITAELRRGCSSPASAPPGMHGPLPAGAHPICQMQPPRRPVRPLKACTPAAWGTWPPGPGRCRPAAVARAC